jgi:hypothetical protein
VTVYDWLESTEPRPLDCQDGWKGIKYSSVLAGFLPKQISRFPLLRGANSDHRSGPIQSIEISWFKSLYKDWTLKRSGYIRMNILIFPKG